MSLFWNIAKKSSLFLVGGVGVLGVLNESAKNRLISAEVEAKEEFPWEAKTQKKKSLDLDWLKFLQEKEAHHTTENEKKKILLLAYPRSGSTFTGDVLSASKSLSYFMEPIFSLIPVGEADWDYFLEDVISKDRQMQSVIQNLMEGIYSCDEAVLERLTRLGNDDWASITVKAAEIEKCKEAKAVLTKTIRLHKDNMDWVHGTNIKVVHLVRDPRGMIGSMLRQPEEWTNRLQSYQKVCRQLEEDLELERTLPQGNYLRVKYEDLVDNPVDKFQEIFEFVGLEFSEDVQTKIRNLYRGEEKDPKASEYYSTLRTRNFRHDAWKGKMDSQTVEEIECDCKTVMEKLGYKTIGK